LHQKKEGLLEICDGCGKKVLPTNVSYLNVDNMRLKLCYKCFDEKTKGEKTIKREIDRRCPNCGRVIPFDAITCPYCSKRFEIEGIKEEKQDKRM